MAEKVIPILSKTLKVNKLPDIAGLIQSMRDLGAKVSVRANKFVECPLCGTKVKLTCGRDFRFHGTCPNCKKEILE